MSIEQVGIAEVGERLCEHFFELAPEAATCFRRSSTCSSTASLRQLFGRVLSAIGLIVVGLQDTSKLVPLLLSLGERHVGYGVNEALWPVLGQAFQATLAEVLGEEAYTPEVQHTWSVVYGFASSIMIAGLHEATTTEQVAARTTTASTSSGKSLDECLCGQSETSRGSTGSFATSASHPSDIGRERNMRYRCCAPTESTASSSYDWGDESA